MIKNILGQVVFFFVVFMLISMIRETRLLGYSEEAPLFVLPSIEGEVLSSHDFSDKPTLVFFWAPWCSVCKVSMPNLEEFYQENKQDVNVVTIALDYSSESEVQMLLNKKGITAPTLLGNPETAGAFKISGYPTYYIVDRDGKVHAKSMGYSSLVGMQARTLTL